MVEPPHPSYFDESTGPAVGAASLRRWPLAAWLLTTCLCLPLPTAAQESPQATTPALPQVLVVSEAGPAVDGVPVMHRGRELYRLKSGIGAITARDRARAVENRIDDLVADTSTSPADIVVRHGEQYSGIYVRGQQIGLITEADAQANGEPRRLLADAVALAIRRAVSDTRAEFSPDRVRQSVIKASAFTIALILLLFLVRIGVRVARRVVGRLADRHIQSLHIQNLEIVSAERMRTVVLSMLRWLWALVCVVGVLGWIEVVLTTLPWTRPFAENVVAWTTAPVVTLWEAFVAFLPNLFYLVTIAAATWGVMLVGRYVMLQVGRGRISIPDFDPAWADPTYKIARVLLIALALVAAFPYLPGSQSPAFQGVSLLLGLIVSLSSSSAIANAIAGIIMTYTNAFRVGDRVRIAEVTGDIVRKATFVTQVRTIKNEIVAIPNALVLATSVQNYSRMASAEGLILHTTVTIGYDAPWRTVHGLLVEAARRTPGLLEDPPPFVLQTALNDFFVSYEVNAYTRAANDMVNILSALHANIQDSFNEGGVEIMSPHIMGVRDANTVTIPAGHRPPGYEAPAFRVGRVKAPGGPEPA